MPKPACGESARAGPRRCRRARGTSRRKSDGGVQDMGRHWTSQARSHANVSSTPAINARLELVARAVGRGRSSEVASGGTAQWDETDEVRSATCDIEAADRVQHRVSGQRRHRELSPSGGQRTSAGLGVAHDVRPARPKGCWRGQRQRNLSRCVRHAIRQRRRRGGRRRRGRARPRPDCAVG